MQAGGCDMTTFHGPSSVGPRRPSELDPYVELRETHSAVVLLVGDRAFKFKKPVDLGFLDFSTRLKRLDACRRELELNRRLAPDVYEGIGDVTNADNSLLEHLLIMKRMPAERRLAFLVTSGADVRAEVREIARAMAAFHSHCARGPAISASGGRDALARRWHDNFVGARPYRGELLPAEAFDRVQRLAECYLAGRDDLFTERIQRGAVVDGHGDLLAEDIFCLPDGPRILDCIDFDDSLRHLDKLDDVACLAMDLERMAASAAARAFLDDYLELSGDHAPASLVDHYTAYRAFMRAKVACVRVRQSGRAAEEPAQLLDLAHRHLVDAKVNLVLVGGSPGTGKSTASAGLADRLGYVRLSADRVRKELAGVSAQSPRAAPYLEGIYTPQWTKRTYDELLHRASALLSMGESVVIDATWSGADLRAAAVAVAERTASDLYQFRCDAPIDVVEARISKRQPGASDADVTIAADVRERFEPWPEAETLDVTESPHRVVSEMVRKIRPPFAPVHHPRPRMAPE